MSNYNNNGKIVYIPGKPPMSPASQPTVSVFASIIEPKLANTLVRRLNQIAPLENLHHVKRVRKIHFEGKIQLSIILSVVGDDDGLPKDMVELINSYNLTPFVSKVSKYAATSKEDWEEQCKLWPTSFHPPTYSIEGISGFSEEDSKRVINYMKLALALANSEKDHVVNAAVIVDPSVNQVIASGCDEIYSWHAGDDTTKQDEYLASNHFVNGLYPSINSLSNVVDKQSYASVGCLNPWQWSQQHLSASKSHSFHPLRHAAMVAIESSAARDKQIYLSMENAVEKSPEEDPVKSPSRKRSKMDHEAPNGSSSKSGSPYLCTGYDIYIAWEPCVMCAMALVHQRIRRIFYALPNPNTGALGSVHRLQGEKSLNHHYAVFRVMLLDEDFTGVEDSALSTSQNGQGDVI